MNKRKNRILPITYRGEDIDSSNHNGIFTERNCVNDQEIADRAFNGWDFQISSLDDLIGDPCWNLDLYTHDPGGFVESFKKLYIRRIIKK